MAEGNKFITSRSAIQNPFPKYRSVKYRVELSALEKVGKSAYQSDMATLPSNPERSSWRKPSSYSQHRRVNSSQTNCVMPEESSQEMKMSYLSTWDRLLSAPDKSQLMESRAVEVMRVHLPAIVSFEPSKFTALDPLFLPIEDIERGIAEVAAALPPDKVEMSNIHQEMIDFQARINDELNHFQREALQALKRFKEMLRADRVEQQAQSMRLKRQAASITLEYQQFRSNFEQTKGRLDEIQTDIFSSRPFNLVHQPDYDEQFPQAYF